MGARDRADVRNIANVSRDQRSEKATGCRTVANAQLRLIDWKEQPFAKLAGVALQKQIAELIATSMRRSSEEGGRINICPSKSPFSRQRFTRYGKLAELLYGS